MYRKVSEKVELSIFCSRLESLCDEMGALLQKAAFSPNIKDRLDFSCAVFDKGGALASQAAHIPVHLGSMAYAMTDIVNQIDWQEGDTIVVNDPFLGGTHLPDVTLITPVFFQCELQGFVANRAHHANIGADRPGSMPITQHLEEEGIVVAPTKLVLAGILQQEVMNYLTGAESLAARNPIIAGDFYAQLSANQLGAKRLVELFNSVGADAFSRQLQRLNNYGTRIAQQSLKHIPNGTYYFEDVLDDDGLGSTEIPIRVKLEVANERVRLDFSGSSPQVTGNLNCPLSVVAAAVFYCFRCLMPRYTPACAGVFSCIEISAPLASLVNAERPAAVAAGNVETSSRIVDVVFGALAQALPERIPAASQGTMNNIAMGARSGKPGSKGRAWDYYETLGGGSGAGPSNDGLSGYQTHMTNTLNTPVESIESHFPLRIEGYALRRNSGGGGTRKGGDGIVRTYRFLEQTEVSLITERRAHAPWGLHGADEGEKGVNLLNGKPLDGKVEFTAVAGDCLSLCTPGGGGWNTYLEKE